MVDNAAIVELINWEPGKADHAWHAMPTANRNFLGAEMCEQTDPARHQEMYNRAAYLVAEVCARYDWDPMEMVTVKGQEVRRVHSHLDVTNAWHESDHVDPDGYLKSHGMAMDQFRADVAVLIEQKKAAVPAFSDINGHWAADAITRLAALKTPVGTPLIQGQLQGDGSVLFNPDRPVTRAEMAVLLDRVLHILGK